MSPVHAALSRAELVAICGAALRSASEQHCNAFTEDRRSLLWETGQTLQGKILWCLLLLTRSQWSSDPAATPERMTHNNKHYHNQHHVHQGWTIQLKNILLFFKIFDLIQCIVLEHRIKLLIFAVISFSVLSICCSSDDLDVLYNKNKKLKKRSALMKSIILGFIWVIIRAVYWQESDDKIRITIQGLRYDILRYIAL